MKLALDVKLADDYGNQINHQSTLSSSIRLKVGNDAVHFFPRDHQSSSRFPEDAVYISPSNWYIKCVDSNIVDGRSSESFIAISPNGIEYTFGMFEEDSVMGLESPLRIHVTSIKDKHGSTLTYSYHRFLTSLQGSLVGSLFSKIRLGSITSSDGRAVNVTYSDGPTPGYISRNNSLTVSGNNIRLVFSSNYFSTTIEREDGLKWVYSIKDYDGINQIESIKYPTGLKVDYEYENRNANLTRVYEGSYNEVKQNSMKKRTIVGIGSTPYVETFEYENTGNAYSEDGINTTLVNSPFRSTRYDYRKINLTEPPNDTPVSSGKLLTKTIYSGDIVVKKIDYTYSRVAGVLDLDVFDEPNNWAIQTGTNGETFDTFIGLLRGVHRSYRTVANKKVIVLDGSSFSTEKSEYNIWGFPRKISESGSGNKITNKTYHNDISSWIIGKLKTESVDGETVNSSFSYDDSGLLTQKNIFGISEFFKYSGGNLSVIEMYSGNDGLETVKTFSDYKMGIARNVTDGAGNTKRIEVDGAGNIQSETDFNGNVMSYQYDSIQRLIHVNYPGHAAKSISWPSVLQKVIVQGNYKKTVSYNAMMQPIFISEKDLGLNGGGISASMEYDVGGRVSFVSFPSSSKGDRYSHDSLGRVTGITNTGDNSSTAFCYGQKCGSGIGSGILIQKPNGATTIKNYLSFGNPNVKYLTSIKEGKGGNSNSIITTISRGKHGQVKGVAQGGVIRSFTHGIGLLITSQDDPETGVTSFSRDARGNILSKQTGMGTTIYTYDNNNRIRTIDYPNDTPSVSYGYDGTNLSSISTSGVGVQTSLQYLWDPMNQIKYETLVVDDLRFVTRYGYDGLGNISYIRLPSAKNQSSSRVVNMDVDALGRVHGIDGIVSNVSYHANGVLASMKYANDQVFNGGLNAKQLPSRISTAKGLNEIVDLSYRYDNGGNITSIIDSINSNNDRHMTYDGLDRLITANGLWGNGSITYADNHDISAITIGDSLTTYSYGSGKLIGTAGLHNKNFNYDSNGNVTSNGKDDFLYDGANQMVSVNNEDIKYTYDGNKKRVRVETPERVVYYFYNLAGELLYRYDKTNNRDIEYINLNGKLIAKIEDTTLIQPTANAYWSPPIVTVGEESTFHWSSTNATTCKTGSGRIVARNGSETYDRNNVGFFKKSTGFSCTGLGGKSNVVYPSITVLDNNKYAPRPKVWAYWRPSKLQLEGVQHLIGAQATLYRVKLVRDVLFQTVVLKYTIVIK